MRKILLLAIVMTFVAACTDYKAQINDAHEQYVSENTFVNKTGIPCGDLWCGPAKQKRIDTGDSKGHWGSYADESDGGNSYFTWDDGSSGTLSSALAETLTEKFLGVGGYFYLGENYKYAYAAARAEFGRVTDAVAWGGVCVVYYSTAPVRLFLSFETAADYGYDMPYVDLPESYFNNKIVDYEGEPYDFAVVDVGWEQFKQEGWTKKYIDAKEAAMQLSGLDFQYKYTMVDANGGNKDGWFRIYSIGRLGTCW